MKICFLVLTHKPVPQLLIYANKHPEHNFYIHVDTKSSLEDISVNRPNNVHFIDKRVDVKWAGFSMVEATLYLIDYALNNDAKNEYFHLLSGDDAILSDNLSWSDDAIYMQCIDSPRHNYRMRFNVPHADNRYTRHIAGKVYTQLIKLLNRVMPSRIKYKFGSQWFSIRREQLINLYNSISQDDIKFFRKKLCPDEHFFQYLVVKNNYLDKLSKEENKRYIVFKKSHQRGSSPVFLDLDSLDRAQKNNYWFARKVDQKTMESFYKMKFNNQD